MPPSEGKAIGGNARRARWSPGAGAFGAALGERRAFVAAALADLGGGDAKLLGVKGDHLDRARSANANLDGALTLPAWERYTGVVWDHLDPATLPAAVMKQIVVVSGLLGLVRGDDPVPDYRLKMGASLPSTGKLSTWWRDDVTATLAHAARRRVLVDLLPQEHRAAVSFGTGSGNSVEGVSVNLVDPTGKPGGHFAKAAKGALARAILTDGLTALDTWSDDRFDLVVTPL
ncbi:MAG: peroxide stress protein YaaA [Ilumatobacteraceae bacterium]